ncbi:MAG: hypothetical protein M3276_00620 [Actinomycetota bacterium]|nr:hypothetical protein [Actinomycetota bacterium]
MTVAPAAVRAAFANDAVVGNDMSGFSDDRELRAAAGAGLPSSRPTRV